MKMPEPHSWHSAQNKEWMANAVYTEHVEQNTFTHRGGTFKTPLYDKQALIDLLEEAAKVAEYENAAPWSISGEIAAAIRSMKEKL